MKEYKVMLFHENLIGSLIFGQSGVKRSGLERELNKYAGEGYRVVTMERETRRLWLFFKRESFIFVLEREKTQEDVIEEEGV